MLNRSGYVITRALPTARFERNDVTIIGETVH
jgi:hypothetical protein